MIVWLAACTSPAPIPVPVAVPVPVQAPPASNQVYVRASTLNLRSGPSSTASSLGRLTINTPLERLATEGDWIQVRVGNGKEGWVGSKFVDPQVLTVDAAIQQARAASEPLPWWQRAAAIDPRRDVLEGLLEAYEAAGKADSAEQIRTQLAWPHTLFLIWKDEALPANTVRVEWNDAGYEAPTVRTLPKESWSGLGLDPEATWYVLPSIGKAVPARATQVTVDLLNECSSEWSRNVWLEHEPLLDGAVPLVASRVAPPASWMQDVRPTTPSAEVEAAVLRAATATLGPEVVLDLAPDGSSWRGTARAPTGRFGELGDTIYTEVRVDWTAGNVTLGPKEVTAEVHDLVGIRDVVGSGEALLIHQDFCASVAEDREGAHQRSTGYRCCGC